MIRDRGIYVSDDWWSWDLCKWWLVIVWFMQVMLVSTILFMSKAV